MALLDPQAHRGAAYHLTGPEAVTFGEVAGILADALGRAIRYVPASVPGYTHHLRRQGLPWPARGDPDLSPRRTALRPGEGGRPHPAPPPRQARPRHAGLRRGPPRRLDLRGGPAGGVGLTRIGLGARSLGTCPGLRYPRPDATCALTGRHDRAPPGSGRLGSFLTLTVLEIVLGVDNVIFISIAAARLPQESRARARRGGAHRRAGAARGLLFSITWIVGLSEPFAEPFGFALSWRDVILLVGGLFLIYKACTEIFEEVEGDVHTAEESVVQATFLGVIAQIMVLDVVFSLDSVITAVGIADHLEVMIAAVVIAIGVMMVAAAPHRRLRGGAPLHEDAGPRVPRDGGHGAPWPTSARPHRARLSSTPRWRSRAGWRGSTSGARGGAPGCAAEADAAE